MRNIFKSKKICIIIIVVVLLYTIILFFHQQKKLNTYAVQKEYYESQKTDLEEAQEELKKEQTNIDSSEFIEEQAREKLDMYYPNERVYIAK